ncbi:hypothetical protein [Nitratireductor thuwali]|uniref:DNA ligase (ATP) n=1 Tax=Nitratireductor thuwali TaxID=2267699 RepID=A0ABY5MLV1_9HYPH|nr:Multifunctional non-homologous end joining protein LigD [Nitratireductor thuwali]
MILARVEEGKLIHAGGVGTGFNAKTGTDARLRLDALKTEKPPVSGLKIKGATWIRPEVVVEVEYRGWTDDQKLRHPSFKGVREDKSAAGLGLGK